MDKYKDVCIAYPNEVPKQQTEMQNFLIFVSSRLCFLPQILKLQTIQKSSNPSFLPNIRLYLIQKIIANIF